MGHMRKHCLKILEVIPEGEEKAYKFEEQQEAAAVEAERWEKEKRVEKQRQLQEKYQRLKHGREQQQKRKQKQQKKKQLQDDDDDTVTTELTQESSLECEEIECNLIDDKDDKHDNNIKILPTQVLVRIKQNLDWNHKRKRKWHKEKYSRKVKKKME